METFTKTKRRQCEPESNAALAKLPTGTVSELSMRIGLDNREPLFYAMDGMLRYAKAYETRHGQKLNDDYVLRVPFIATISGLRALLNGDGVYAMERGISTDSKDNGVIEEIFWAAMNAAGCQESDL